MGLSFTYQDRRPIPPPLPRNWLVMWIDPETGKRDTAEYFTEADAIKHATDVTEVYGVPATVTNTGHK